YLVGLIVIAILLGLIRLAVLFLQRRIIASGAAAATARLQRDVFLHSFSQDAAVSPASGARMAELLREAIPAVERGLVAQMDLVPREPVRVASLLIFVLVVNLWLGTTFLLIALLAWMVGSIALREAALRIKRYSAAHHQAVERL